MATSAEGSGNAMPSSAATPAKSPQQILQGRAASAVPGLVAAGHAVGLGHIAQVLSDARRRVREGHRAMARAAGMEDLAGLDNEEAMNITVTGDVHSTPPPSKPSSNLLPWILAAATGSGLLGAAGTAAWNYFGTPSQLGQVQKIESKEGFLIELVPGDKK
ncbi:MAG: hypothetical protein AAB538_02850 [Patescibacteria group bacterium]